MMSFLKDLREKCGTTSLRPQVKNENPRVPNFLLQIPDPNSVYCNVVPFVWSIYIWTKPENAYQNGIFESDQIGQKTVD